MIQCKGEEGQEKKLLDAEVDETNSGGHEWRDLQLLL
jgi:hypothetical protein